MVARRSTLKTQEAIEDNVVKALRCIVGTEFDPVPSTSQAPAPKRHCSAPISFREQAGSKASPADVAVRLFSNSTILQLAVHESQCIIDA